MIRPTAHRSRAWTRQKGGLVGWDRLGRAAGFFVVRAGARDAAPPRVLVTTVGPRLLPDLVLFVDTPPVELRTCVRYRSPHGAALGPGGERGGWHALRGRAGGGAARRQGRLRRDGVPARQRPHHHQHGAGGEPHALPAHDQSLPGMQPRLRVLLRPADARLSRPRDRHGLRAQDRRQGERRGPAAGRAARAGLGGRPHRHGHQHRPLPARRGQVPPDEGDRGDPLGGSQPVQHPDQVDADPAGRRAVGRRVRAHGRHGELLRGHARPLRVVADRARHSPAGPPGRGPAATDRHGHPVRRPGGTGAAGPLGLRGPADGGGRGLRGGRGGVRLGRRAAPAGRGARSLPRLAPGRAAGPRAPPPGAVPEGCLSGGRRARAGGGHRADGGTPVWRDGTGALPRHAAAGPPAPAPENSQQLRLL